MDKEVNAEVLILQEQGDNTWTRVGFGDIFFQDPHGDSGFVNF